jgi:16S rRNA (uracil1498-N3)-methyltransferase
VATNLSINQTVEFDKELSHYINNVLRLPNATQIFLFNNSGAEYTAVIESAARNKVTAIITAHNVDKYESPLQINLGQVLSKTAKFDLVIQKATELGVHSITPLYSDFSIIKPVKDRVEAKNDHWHKVAIAACCQSWRNQVPNINEPQAINTWIENNNDPLKLILTPDPNAKRINAINPATQISILIGPEGGFSANEISLAQKNNFIPISLGPRILRTETAGLAVIAILQATFGDM